MKHFIEKATITDNSKSGIVVVSVDDSGQEVRTPLNKRTSDGYVYLPDFVVNSTNRRMFKIANGLTGTRVELTEVAFREARVLGGRRAEAERKPLEDWLTDPAEREMYLELKTKAEAAREEYINHVPTELEKAQEQLAKMQALVAKLMAEQK